MSAEFVTREVAPQIVATDHGIVFSGLARIVGKVWNAVRVPTIDPNQAASIGDAGDDMRHVLYNII